MCLSCTIEEVTGVDLSTDEGHEQLAALGRIPWPRVTDEMKEAAALIKALWETPAGGTGGPLHIVTDDDNVDDHHLTFCREGMDKWWGHEDYEEYEAKKTVMLSTWILDLLDPLDTKQRAVTISLASGFLSEIHGRVYMPATEFPIREEVLDEDGKVIGTQWGFRSRTVHGGLAGDMGAQP